MTTPSRENTNGSSGACMGCCLGEDANLAAAPLAQSLFFRPKVFRPRERRPPMGRRRHTMAVEALVSPRATRRSSRRNSRRSSQPNSVHKWPKTAPRGRFRRSVYTLTPPRLLARPSRYNSVHKWQKTVSRGHSRRLVYTLTPPRLSTTVQQCTQMVRNSSKRLL